MDACPQENEVLLLFKKEITEFLRGILVLTHFFPPFRALDKQKSK
jgi:hypothetical protein